MARTDSFSPASRRPASWPSTRGSGNDRFAATLSVRTKRESSDHRQFQQMADGKGSGARIAARRPQDAPDRRSARQRADGMEADSALGAGQSKDVQARFHLPLQMSRP